jgi:hypothetical protein
MNDETLLARMSALPGVKRASYSPLTEEQQQQLGAAGRAITCFLGGEVERYVAMGTNYIARGEIYVRESMIQDAEAHDEIVRNMTTAIKMFSPHWSGAEITGPGSVADPQ